MQRDARVLLELGLDLGALVGVVGDHHDVQLSARATFFKKSANSALP